MSKFSFKSILHISVFVFCVSFCCSCAVSANDSRVPVEEKPTVETKSTEQTQSAKPNTSVAKTKIQFVDGSPADTVRLFYKNLRERRFKEAMMMTNLRPAVEGLTDADMQDLNSDFEPLAAQVPEVIEINGEIISGNQATVTAKLPDNETGLLEQTQVELRRENNAWVIITAGKDAEALARKEGKNYFFTLRIDVHHVEVERMMKRISKAQSIYAAQSGGYFADLSTLVSSGLLPEDVNETKSTGYRFTLTVAANKKRYYANAIPEVYGKTGKLSFLLESEVNDQQARLKSTDNKGQPLKK